MRLFRKVLPVLAVLILVLSVPACEEAKKTEQHGDFTPPPPTPLKDRGPPGGTAPK